eukprot:c9562_g1_i1.p1 GENE.c9562_g1_i1~~c9562_g1_i1.p1  ORF type:complete len:487 (-),score=42.75 c9562_g1_i1:42-1502(-)
MKLLILLVCLVCQVRGSVTQKQILRQKTMITTPFLTSLMGQIASSSTPLLVSRNGLWSMSFVNGCIKIFDSNGLFVWKIGAPDCSSPNALLSLTPNNRLKITIDGVVLWQTFGGGTPNGMLLLDDDRDLVIQDKGENVIYRSGTGFSDCMKYDEKWVSGQTIPRGSVIRSPNRQYSLAFEDNGRLVLYDSNFPVWGTNPSPTASITFNATTRVFSWTAPGTQSLVIDPGSTALAQTCLVVKNDRTLIMHLGYFGDSGIVYTAPTKVRMLKGFTLLTQALGSAPPIGAAIELQGKSNSLTSSWIFMSTRSKDFYLMPVWTDIDYESITGVSAGTYSNSIPFQIMIPQTYHSSFGTIYQSYINYDRDPQLPPITGVGLWRSTNASGIDQIPFGHSTALAPFFVGYEFLYIVYTTGACLPDTRSCTSATCSQCCNSASWHPNDHYPVCGYIDCKRKGTLCGPTTPFGCGECCNGSTGTPNANVPVSICG